MKQQPPKTPRTLVTLALALSLGACDAERAPADAPTPTADEPSPAAPGPIAGADALAGSSGPVTRLPGFDVSLELEGDDVVLGWALDSAPLFEVWRSEQPYFEPGDPGSELLGTTPTAGFVDAGGNAAEAPSHYYVVVATGSGAAQRSTTVGRQSLTFHPGFNKVPLSLQTGLADAEGVFEAMSPGLTELFYFVSESQSWLSWDPSVEHAPFQVFDGTTPVAMMDLEAPVQRVLTGYVPAVLETSVRLHPGDNLVTMPLFFPPLPASALLAGIPSAMQVGRWDAETQLLHWVTGAPGEDDLLIPPGADFHLMVAAPALWPLSVVDPEGEDALCCAEHAAPGCGEPAVEACVCALDSFCCDGGWDDPCVVRAFAECGAGCAELDQGGDGDDDAGPGDCCQPTEAPGCLDADVQACVCAEDSFCCEGEWDGLCVDEVTELGCGTCGA
ncbi:MAG: hypothetical protein KDK70_05775 [Myxococcales bacterium]|nr:hypothetical protein [Myxococcales bacterium]